MGTDSGAVKTDADGNDSGAIAGDRPSVGTDSGAVGTDAGADAGADAGDESPVGDGAVGDGFGAVVAVVAFPSMVVVVVVSVTLPSTRNSSLNSKSFMLS